MIEIKKILEKFSENLINSLKKNMSDYGLGDSNLANSLHAEVDESKVEIWANDYWDYAQKGSKPWSGAGDGSFFPRFENILMDWVVRHRISVPEPRKFVSNVKWSIIKKGSRLYRNPSEQRDFVKNAVDENLKLIEDELKESFVKEIKLK